MPSTWDDGWNYRLKPFVSFTIGPFYINDVQGTATEEATLAYFNTGTALSRSANELKMSKPGSVVGMIMMSDDTRTAGTATARVQVNNTGTAFNSGDCVLNATNTISVSSFTSYAAGVPFVAGDTLGCEVTTDGWTPTSADLAIWMIVQLKVF